MDIRNVLHKGLRRFMLEDDTSGVQAAVVSKLRHMLSFLQDMQREDELRAVPSWKAHQLTGSRKGCMEPVCGPKLETDLPGEKPAHY